MGINNPIPMSLKAECRKAAKVLASFIKPNQAFGPDQVIPPNVLQEARGLAVITVLKAGFLFSGRAGSGVIVARLPDGSWSAPSAIVTAGAGVGGQIGAELTDFVFILNTDEAVKSFAQFGSITLGGNISVAAGPLGRNAEAGATGSLKAVAPVFSYSKTKGLFAGVSLEGSAIVERREANRKFYGENCKAATILAGRVRAPPACEPLFRVLESRAFTRGAASDDYSDDEFYNDIPSAFSSEESSPTTSSRYYGGSRARRYDDYDEYSDEDSYERGGSRPTRSGHGLKSDDDEDDDSINDVNRRFRKQHFNSSYSDKPIRPKSEKPDFGTTRGGTRSSPAYASSEKPISSNATSKKNTATALFSFEGEQSGDLPFKKGDIIAIIQKSDSTDDWWTGRINGKEGIFPANYVKLN
ncbi:hypothetical protein PACTADRAFT_65904 [Pachysolen tannophilus NRRL Y-2460]|uniref:SH3 domain-containing protein n=1 Tax=Pachysolen tannophilus NRRL Y-2460 TaxID=669874 RepID=A0A1E4TZ92_PACTA|nr:hypothetical protein PACTADRAFT_65904 [Pachysolen tannophilus NRRL Y-2460]